MKGAIVHGVLLAVMLVYGYRTWTREKSLEPTLGAVVVWNRPASDVQAVLYTSPRKSVRVERRTAGAEAYWWGIESRTDRRAKALPDSQKATLDAGVAADAGAAAKGPVDAGVAAPPAGGDAGAAVATAGDAGAPAAEAPKTDDDHEIITTTTEFAVGPKGEDLIKGVASMRAIRALGKLTEDNKKEYGLDIGDTSLAVIFTKGPTSTFVLGNKVSGGKERYAVDPDTGVGYVVSGSLVEPLETAGEIKLTDPKGFDAAQLATVTIKAGDKTRQVARITTTNDKGEQTKTWGDAATKKPDQTMANFVDSVDRLRPSTFDPALKIADLKPIVALTYKDDRGRTLTELALYRRERPSEPPADGTVDPTMPPPAVAEYYIVTPITRVPALVSKGSAERIEQDVATVLR